MQEGFLRVSAGLSMIGPCIDLKRDVRASMTKVPHLSDPTDLSALRGYIAAADPEARLDPLGLERLTISDDVHLGLAEIVGEALRASSMPG